MEALSKKLLIRAAGYGAGTVAMLGIIALGIFLWIEHAQRPKPFDTHALTAEYESLHVAGDDRTFVFIYAIQNNSDYDYSLSNGNDIQFGATLKNGALLNEDKKITIGYPLLVPAKSKVSVFVNSGLHYKGGPPEPGSDNYAVNKDYRIQASRYLVSSARNLSGFTLFDTLHRYKVAFPDGWVKEAKEKLSTDK
jgi:hypothetical protein